MITINERTCITCHWAGWDYVAEDFTCRNPNSAWTNEFVGSDMTCPQWKEPEQIGLLWKAWLEDLPSAEPTLYGYPVEHLAMIAYVLQKENFPPERIAEMLSDIGLIVEMVRCEFEETLRDEFEETLRKVTERRTDEND